MPLYDYRCERCGQTREVAKPLASYDEPEVCDECQREMEKYFPTAPGVDLFPEFTTNHLHDKTDGKPVTFNSLSDIRKFEKEHNVVWEPGSYNTKHLREDYGKPQPKRKSNPGVG